MKKYIFLFVMLSSFMKGQNYAITMYDTIKYGNCGDLLLPTVTFSNTSASPVQMFFRRILKNIPTGWTSCFCAPTCLAQTQDSLSFTIPIATGKNGAVQNISPNFGTDTIPGVGHLIVIFNEVGVNHYDTIYFRGVTSKLAGIKTYEKESFILFPNPTADFIYLKNIENEIKAVRIFNILGEEVFKTTFNKYENDLKINVSNLVNGQYFLNVLYSDNSTSRKKIIKTQ